MCFPLVHGNATSSMTSTTLTMISIQLLNWADWGGSQLKWDKRCLPLMGSSTVARNLFRTAGGTVAAFLATRENMLQHDFLCFFEVPCIKALKILGSC